MLKKKKEYREKNKDTLKQYNKGVISVLVVTRPKSLAFGATPGFGGDFKFSFGFGGDKKLSLLVSSQVKLILSPKQRNPQQAEQGHAQMQQCV